MIVKVILSISYLLVILASIGMLLFATKFPFSTNIRDLELAQERVLGLNGYQVWKYSWAAIVVSTVGQLIACWLA